MISIILAAGRGTRMSPLTDDTPKSLLPFKGETVLTRLIGQIDRRTKDRIIVVVGHEKGRIIDAVNSENEDRGELCVAYLAELTLGSVRTNKAILTSLISP